MNSHRTIDPGIYRHFKGNEYEVLGIARHSETEEAVVVYRALYGDYGLWVRPLPMFCEKVDGNAYPDAKQTYRFERVGDAPACKGDFFAETAFEAPRECASYDVDELAEAARQIESITHKIEATLATLESKDDPKRYRPQITLAKRRLRAFEIASRLIEDEAKRNAVE